MKTVVTLACLFSGAIAAGLFFRHTIPTTPPDSAKVDWVFAKFDRADSPGCSVGVSKNGRVVYEHGYGMANLELGVPISPASVFHVASISKQFTAMSIQLLARQGQLSLDDDVRKHIPDFASSGTPVTIRHLLTHTSGLRDGYFLRELVAPLDDRVDRMDAIVELLARQKGLNFPPGSQYQYNNSGYTVLAAIVKRVSGQSLSTFAEANIFKPLGMTHTHFHDDPAMIIPNRAIGYHGDGALARAALHADLGRVVGNTGLFTTARDLLAWEQNFAYVRVGDPALLRAMQTPTKLTGGGISPYGLGLQMSEYRGLRTVEHSGGDPGYAANLVRFPDQGIAIAVLCNRDDIDLVGRTNSVADIYLADRFSPSNTQTTSTATAALNPLSLTAEQLAPKAGLYRDASSGAIGQILLRGGKLMAHAGGDDLELTPVSTDRFVIAGTPITIEFTSEEIRVAGAGPQPLVSQKVNTALSNTDMRAFAGEYLSPELGVKYALTATDTGLVLQRPSRPKIVLQLTATDEFFGDTVEVVKFSRDRRGTVTGFTIKSTGARNLEFDRVKQ